MPKCQLAIVVREQDYMKRLADYVRNSPYAEQWQIVAFSSSAACVRYVDEGYRLDMIAGQPSLLAEMSEHAALRTIPCVALVMNPGQSGEEMELRQYQPLPELLQRLSDFYKRSQLHMVKAVSREESSKAVAVYSTAGGAGKTSLALHLAQAAGARGLQVFYLNLELWNASADWLGTAEGEAASSAAGLSDMLYRLKTEPDQAPVWLSEHRGRHPLLKGDFLAPAANAEDRLTLGCEDGGALLDAVKRCGLYDLIVIDMDASLGDLETGIFDEVEHVLWVVDERADNEGKRQLKLQYGRQRWGERFERLSRKFLYIRNRSLAGSAVHDQERRWASVHLPEAAEWRELAKPRLLSSPAYRAAVDKLFLSLYGEGEYSRANG